MTGRSKQAERTRPFRPEPSAECDRLAPCLCSATTPGNADGRLGSHLYGRWGRARLLTSEGTSGSLFASVRPHSRLSCVGPIVWGGGLALAVLYGNSSTDSAGCWFSFYFNIMHTAYWYRTSQTSPRRCRVRHQSINAKSHHLPAWRVVRIFIGHNYRISHARLMRIHVCSVQHFEVATSE